MTRVKGLRSIARHLRRRWARFLVNEIVRTGADDLDGEKTQLALQLAELAWQVDPLAMPLGRDLHSSRTPARFFEGENSVIKAGSFVTDDSRIGANTYIGYRCMITSARIGRYVSIANNVSIGPGEHDPRNVSTSSFFYEDELEQLTRGDCIIGHDVWIGNDCLIRRGVNIGIGAVVGANSFVNRDVEPFAIVAGSPARVVGHRFAPAVSQRILSSRWWDLPLEEARMVVHALDLERKRMMEAAR